jgi:hypothetical protein
VFHLADREPYRRLNEAVCVCAGEVRVPSDPAQTGPDLVIVPPPCGAREAFPGIHADMPD